MRYIFNPITEQLEAPDNPSPMYDNLGKKFKLAESVLPYDFDDLTPKEEQYYQQDKFSTHPDFLAAKGGLARKGFEDAGAADDFDGQRTYTKDGKKYRTEEFKAHLRSKTQGIKTKYPDFKGTTHVGGKKTKEYAEYVYQQDKKAGKIKKWSDLTEEQRQSRTQKNLEWQKSDEGKDLRKKRHKIRTLKKNPLSKVDQSVLNRFKLNLKYLKHMNEIIKENGGMRPNTEVISDLMEIRFDADPEFQSIWNKVNGNKPFSTKNLSPSSLSHTYNRAVGGSKRVTADNFKKAIQELFEAELQGTGTTFDDLIKNDFKLNETFIADQVDSPQAKYERRYKSILRGESGWTPEGRGSWAWFANPDQKGATITTNINKKLGTNKLSRDARGALEFVRSHYFGNIQAQKLKDLKLLGDDSLKNWKERYTWKPRYINDLQSMTYDRDIYKALSNYSRHGNKVDLAKDLNNAATKAKRIGLDVDELKLNADTGKFDFVDKKRVVQTGGDRETRFLIKNAMYEVAKVQSANPGQVSDDIIKNIKEDYGKRADKIINQVKKGGNYFYDADSVPKWAQRINKPKDLIGDKTLRKVWNVAKGPLKYVGKTALKTVGPFIPWIAPVAIGIGVKDMAKASEMGMNQPHELGTAYYLGPEVAKGWDDIETYDYKGRLVKEIDQMKESWQNRGTGTGENVEVKEEMMFAEGGIVPRVAYKDGSNWLDKLTDDDVYNLSRGWRTDMKMDPDVMDRIKQKQILDAQAANEAGFKHRSQYEDTGSFIPAYVQDVVKKGFGTEEGLKYIGSKAGEGAVEGFEWFIYQLPHLVKELDKRGLMPGLDGQNLSKMKKHLEKNKGKFNWMELMYTPNWGEEFLGFKMNDFQKEQIEKLKDRFGETEIPEGIASTGTAAELGTMFLADPFIIWGAGSKLSKLKGKKDKLVDVDETIDIGRRDFTKTVGTVGLTAFLAKTFPFLFKTKKDLTAAKNVAKVAETVKQFGNVRGMPEWLPSFILKAKNDGKLLSLPDKHYVEGFVYNIDLPVKRRYYPDGMHGKQVIRTEQVPVRVEINPNSGEVQIHWTGTDNYGDEIERSMFYKPGETGTQNYAVDEFGRGTSKEEVVIQDPEFEYTEPDWSGVGPEDTPDSPAYLDAYDDADEIVEAMEELVKGSSKEFKTQAANEMKLYNQTDEHLGDATGHQTSDGDWVSGDDNMPFPSYDKEVKDVYHPKWNRKKKAMGGVASGPAPLSGPVPEGLRSLKPGAIYNEWIN